MKVNISEFAKVTGVSVRTLHYYDEINLLKPDFVDEQNGYRLILSTVIGMAHTYADIPIIIFVDYADCYVAVFRAADIPPMVFTVAKAVCYAVSHLVCSSALTAHADCFSVISSVVVIAFGTAFVHTDIYIFTVSPCATRYSFIYRTTNFSMSTVST